MKRLHLLKMSRRCVMERVFVVVRYLGMLWIAMGMLSSAYAQTVFNRTLRESVYKVNVTITDRFARTETIPVVLTVYRPPIEGRFPLMILNHGRASAAERSKQPRQRYAQEVKYFISKGFVVIVPTRIGYGETYGTLDPEDANACRLPTLAVKDEALYRQIMATYEFAKTQDYIDTTQWVVAGQSLGGYTTVTIAKRAPPGLVGAINFSGGFGGSPEERRANPCGAHSWEQSLTTTPSARAVPTLWVYWLDDWFWGNVIPQRWFNAFIKGGGVGELVQLPALTGNSHYGFSRNRSAWAPLVDQFMAKLPLQLSALTLQVAAIPSPTGYARPEDYDKVPYIKYAGLARYKEFVTTKNSPRAFAINRDGKWSYAAETDDASEIALENCNNNAQSPCALYVVDSDVVWKPQ